MSTQPQQSQQSQQSLQGIQRLRALAYRHVDVFSREPLSGNGLTVFPDARALDGELMQLITREMRQFESIFLIPTSKPRRHQARIFTMEEELPFAGHPVLGAAAVLHEHLPLEDERAEWILDLAAGPVRVGTIRRDGWYEATMNQGRPVFGPTPDAAFMGRALAALNLTTADLAPNLPLAVVSTGLPYLLVPLIEGLERAAIVQPGFEQLLATVGAKFVYVLHLPTLDGRTWDNDGRVEDVATGSAAGPVGAYLVRQALASSASPITLNQGRFLGRPSQMRVRVEMESDEITTVHVGGDVRMVARGAFD